MPQIRPEQIKGAFGNTIKDDVESINKRTQNLKSPVATKADLPLEGNSDGDMRLVLDEDIIYDWDQPTLQWKGKTDKNTESRTLTLIVESDGQTDFNTNIDIGIENGLASMQSVGIEVNGVGQKVNADYTLEASMDTIPKLIIKWKSTDFELETTDDVSVVYDVLLLK